MCISVMLVDYEIELEKLLCACKGVRDMMKHTHTQNKPDLISVTASDLKSFVATEAHVMGGGKGKASSLGTGAGLGRQHS